MSPNDLDVPLTIFLKHKSSQSTSNIDLKSNGLIKSTPLDRFSENVKGLEIKL